MLIATLVSTAVTAATGHWTFGQPVDVTQASGEKIFHHLESSGRRNLAVSGQRVAIIWEDNRDGTPRVYWTSKPVVAANFSRAIQISGHGEAYEPTIVALGGTRFALAWEEDGQIYVRIASAQKLGPTIKLSNHESGQASLTLSGGQIIAVYSEQSGRHRRVVLERLAIRNQQNLAVVARCTVDSEPHRDAQLYPTVVMVGNRLLVAWEDRRPGHTIIMVGQSQVGKTCLFDQPVRISQRPRGPRPPRPAYGKGHGVSRVSLAAYGSSNVFAAWADKRDYREGYDIYGADKPANQAFGPNVRVQDDFGGIARQWHVALAGHRKGRLVVAWDDEREGHADVVLSWREAGHWSEDLLVPGASGPGEQTHPSIVLDSVGNLHLSWVERKVVGGPTRLRYLLGRVKE